MITRLAVSGYRSLRDLVIPLAPLSVVTGANGSGKSSLYRALKLLADVAQGRLIPSLAAEGGLPSTLWAGPHTIGRAVRRGTHPVEATVRSTPVSLKLGFSGADYGYAVDLGLPTRPPEFFSDGGLHPSLFSRDPEIKAESLWLGEGLRRASALATRNGPSVLVRGESGEWRRSYDRLAPFDSMITHCADPTNGLELLVMRERMRDWRFYDHIRSDRDAPARRAQVGTHTPVLAGDGADLAAAVQTIREIGDAGALDAAIADAFPGARVDIVSRDGVFDVSMRQHGLLRPLSSAELSDGTLRYLLLVAALLSPRPPMLMVLNEPETSLHPDLLAPLARLVARAGTRAQIVVVSHAPALVAALGAIPGALNIVLAKSFGETVAEGLAKPAWTWPSR